MRWSTSVVFSSLSIDCLWIYGQLQNSPSCFIFDLTPILRVFENDDTGHSVAAKPIMMSGFGDTLKTSHIFNVPDKTSVFARQSMRWTLVGSLRIVIRLCVLKRALSESVLGYHRRVKVIETATLCSPPTFFTVPPIFSASFSLSIFWPMPHITFFTLFSAFRFYFLRYNLSSRISNTTCSVSSHSINPTQPVQRRNIVTNCMSWMLMRMIKSNCDTSFSNDFTVGELLFQLLDEFK